MSKVTTRFNKLLLTAGLIAVGGSVQAAPIVTFDFGAAAVGHEQGNKHESDVDGIGLRFDGTNAVFTDSFSGPGLQVIATGQNLNGSRNPFAYLDAPSEGRSAGLGVCQKLSAKSQCTPNDDDNITGANGIHEQLTLMFNQDVTLSGLTFRGENHFGLDETSTKGSPELDSIDTFLLNGESTTFGDAENGLLSLTGSQFTFAFGGDNPEQFYLGTVTAAAGGNTDVPAPAGLGLFGLALIGIGAAVRRRRTI